jgi:orotate phosphoribosyltransferase
MLKEYSAAELLLDIGAVTFRPVNPFRYESGLLSPIYVDCRLLPSYPRECALVAESLTEAFKQTGARAEVVVGTGASAIPLADRVSRRLGLPMAYVRKEQKTYGLRKQIEGAPVEKRHVLLISDIISTGADIPTSVEAVTTCGGTISRCLAVFDMELDENARYLAEHKIDYGTLTRLSELLVVAEIKQHLTKPERILVEEWHQSPADWDKRRGEKLANVVRRNNRTVAEILLRTKAVQIRTDPPFEYSGGGKGPIYTDNRILLAYPAERAIILNAMADLVLQEVGIQNIDCIGAVATAGIPHASRLAERLTLPMLIVKSSAEGHGLKRRIDGALKPGMRVLLLEDLVNQGTSTIAAANALRDAGTIVVSCMSVFTYGLKATRDKFVDSNLSLVSLSDLDSLLMTGVADGEFTLEQRQLVQTWAANPEGWLKAK